MNRKPMTPAEFDANCRELIRRCPFLSETSGARSESRNTRLGAHPKSKHLSKINMARDFGAESQSDLECGARIARELGFWVKVHDIGHGSHIHTQGLAPGPIPDWWMEQHASGTVTSGIESHTRKG